MDGPTAGGLEPTDDDDASMDLAHFPYAGLAPGLGGGPAPPPDFVATDSAFGTAGYHCCGVEWADLTELHRHMDDAHGPGAVPPHPQQASSWIPPLDRAPEAALPDDGAGLAANVVIDDAAMRYAATAYDTMAAEAEADAHLLQPPEAAFSDLHMSAGFPPEELAYAAHAPPKLLGPRTAPVAVPEYTAHAPPRVDTSFAAVAAADWRAQRREPSWPRPATADDYPTLFSPTWWNPVTPQLPSAPASVGSFAPPGDAAVALAAAVEQQAGRASARSDVFAWPAATGGAGALQQQQQQQQPPTPSAPAGPMQSRAVAKLAARNSKKRRFSDSYLAFQSARPAMLASPLPPVSSSATGWWPPPVERTTSSDAVVTPDWLGLSPSTTRRPAPTRRNHSASSLGTSNTPAPHAPTLSLPPGHDSGRAAATAAGRTPTSGSRPPPFFATTAGMRSLSFDQQVRHQRIKAMRSPSLPLLGVTNGAAAGPGAVTAAAATAGAPSTLPSLDNSMDASTCSSPDVGRGDSVASCASATLGRPPGGRGYVPVGSAPSSGALWPGAIRRGGSGAQLEGLPAATASSQFSPELHSLDLTTSPTTTSGGSPGPGQLLPTRSEERPYQCCIDGCTKTYKNANGLKYHLQHGHQPEDLNAPDKPYKCPQPACNKSYKNANGLKYHLSHAHGAAPELRGSPAL